MKKTVLMVAALLCTFACFAQVVDFEDLTLEPNSSWNGSDGTGQFTSSYLTLYNDYNDSWGSWQGFAYTNGTDTESEASTNLSSCVGHGAGNSATYVTGYVGFDWMGDYSPIPVGMKINTEVAGSFAHRGAYFCMPVALKKYVDREYPSGHFYYKLKASAYANGTLVGEREIMMADFSGENSYMMDDWTFVDLSWIENADSLNFIALSDDANAYGILTPAYFNMDNFGAQDPNYINYTDVVDFEEFELAPNTAWNGDPDAEDGSSFSSSYLTLYNINIPDWSYWEGFAYTNGTDVNTYGYSNLSAIVGSGNGNSENYVTCYMGYYNMSGLKIDTEHSGDFTNRGAYFCLPTYVSKYIDDENISFAENHFYYSVKITAYAAGEEIDNREIVMADFREDASYKMDDWTFVDLSWIANADSLYFLAIGNDTAGGWGLNTPAYFCMDDFGAQNPYPAVVDFEELELAPNTAWNGDPDAEDGSSFSSSYLTLYNINIPDWSYWEGFAYTNGTDVNTYGYSNLSAIVGSGNGNSENYVTCYMGYYNMSGLKIDTEHSGDFTNRGAYFCLPTYVSKYIDDENVSFAENHFYYSVKITAYAAGEEVDNREIVMADFREDRTYKMDEWTLVDLSWIANADSLYFLAIGNDTAGGWGINTPTYFCMDDFGAPAYTITATAGENGTITPSGEIVVAEGGEQSFTIEAATGYHIASVMVDEVEAIESLVDGVYTFTNVTESHTIAATFAINTFTITATAGENGTITPEEATVNYGANAEFTITPATGYHIVSVMVDETENVTETVIAAEGVYTFENVTANHTIAAAFAINNYIITATAGDNGTITPAQVSVNYGASQEITITANDGYRIASVMVDETEDVTAQVVDGVYTFENVTADHTIAASFEAIPSTTHTITLTVGEHGTVTASDEDDNEITIVDGVVTVNDGEDVYLDFTPAENYKIETLTVNGIEYELDEEEELGFTLPMLEITEDMTVSVTFTSVDATEMLEASSMAVYPNPNNGMFSIDFSGIEGDATYQLIDARGTIVETRDINVMDGATMDFSNDLKAGTYFVRIIAADKVYVEQIVVE